LHILLRGARSRFQASGSGGTTLYDPALREIPSKLYGLKFRNVWGFVIAC